jgi:hypothetical protein
MKHMSYSEVARLPAKRMNQPSDMEKHTLCIWSDDHDDHYYYRDYEETPDEIERRMCSGDSSTTWGWDPSGVYTTYDSPEEPYVQNRGDQLERLRHKKATPTRDRSGKRHPKSRAGFPRRCKGEFQ